MATKKWDKAKDKDYVIKDHHQELTDKIVTMMEESEKTGWTKPWFTSTLRPYNPVTGTQYKGINVVSLMTSGFDDPRFFTFNNIKEHSEKTGIPMHIKKGAKGTPVFKAMHVMFKEKGQEDTPDEPAAPGATGGYWKQICAGYVFNASQIEGIEPLVVRENKVEPHAEVELLTEALIARTNLQVKHSEVGRAFYSPAQHIVHMPNKELFKTSAGYYSTLLHEETHATGKSLGRDLSGGFGSESYRKEELVAELGSYFLASELGVPYDSSAHENIAEYLNGWLGMMKEDKHLIFWAAGKGSKATEFNMIHLQEHKLELDQKKELLITKVQTAHKEPEQKKTLTMSM
jgi:antirestriction protein ArdC